MNKEQFIAIGLTEEQATKCAEQSAEELKTYIPKTRFDEVNTAKKKAEDDIKERDKQLETLGKDASSSAELKAQIAKLQEENKLATEKAASELKELQMSNAIKLALNGKVHDEDLVTGLFDRTKLLLQEDGKVTGLEEQIKAIKESKAFLFKEETPEQKAGFHIGANAQQQGNQGNASPSLKSALESYYTK